VGLTGRSPTFRGSTGPRVRVRVIVISYLLIEVISLGSRPA